MEKSRNWKKYLIIIGLLLILSALISLSVFPAMIINRMVNERFVQETSLTQVQKLRSCHL